MSDCGGQIGAAAGGTPLASLLGRIDRPISQLQPGLCFQGGGFIPALLGRQHAPLLPRRRGKPAR